MNNKIIAYNEITIVMKYDSKTNPFIFVKTLNTHLIIPDTFGEITIKYNKNNPADSLSTTLNTKSRKHFLINKKTNDIQKVKRYYGFMIAERIIAILFSGGLLALSCSLSNIPTQELWIPFSILAGFTSPSIYKSVSEMDIVSSRASQLFQS